MKTTVLLAAAALMAAPTLAQAKAAAATNTAVHTTKSGKKITYDCSKKGNANKMACKKK